MACVIAVDAGTSSIRSLAVDDRGEVLATAGRPLTQHFPEPGWVEHDPRQIWSAVCETLSELVPRLGASGPLVALGITNQRETVVPWNRRTGEILHPAIVWQDRRTVERCEALERQGLLPEIRARTGLVLDPYFSATKMEWLLRDGGLGHLATSGDLALGTVDAWILWNLTGGSEGGRFATDATNASRTMLFDLGRRTWSAELCDLFGVPEAVLPSVAPSCGRFAVVAGTVGGRLGLGGVPVSGIAGDQHAALFGQACTEPGMAKATYGTGSFVLVNCGPHPPEAAPGLLTTLAWDLGEHAGGVDRVAYALEGSSFVSGAAIQWLRDGLGIISRSEEIGPLAASVPDSAGVVFVPAFSGLGSPWWDPRARGLVSGLTRGVGRPHLARAVVEAMAFQVRDIVTAMAGAAGRPITRLRVDGGASVMDLLLAIQADQLGIGVDRPRSVETTALGAAWLAGLAEGLWDTVDAVTRTWTADAEHRPRCDQAAADALYEPWRRAIDRSRAWS